MTEEDSQGQLHINEAQEKLKARAASAGLSAEIVENWRPGNALIRVSYPCGRKFRDIEYDENEAAAVLPHDLSTCLFLPDLEAVIFIDTHTVEMRVRARQAHMLTTIPGFSVPQSSDSEGSEGGIRNSFRLPDEWSLSVRREHVTLELSPASRKFRAILASSPHSRGALFTLKFAGLTARTTADTRQVVQRLTDAFLFDMDARYGVALEPVPAPHRVLRTRMSRVHEPPAFPKNRYHAQPVALYRYGRAAIGLPLLSFLAYYQVLEFFFPIFTQEEITRRLRQTLASPRFDPNDDVSLARLVAVIKPNARTGVSEKEQLRSTIKRCLDTDALTEFITASAPITKYFCERPQPVPGLVTVRLAGGADLKDQITDRIYDIRCRIVHTKSDGGSGDGAVDLLLPSGREAKSLGPDIELVRLAAQEAIIAGSAALDLH